VGGDDLGRCSDGAAVGTGGSDTSAHSGNLEYNPVLRMSAVNVETLVASVLPPLILQCSARPSILSGL